MKFIDKKKESRNGFLEQISSGVKDIIDNSKERYILKDLSEGLSNRILFEKFSSFRWPLWLESVRNNTSSNNRTYPGPVLLNTSFREWQVFTNYFSVSGIAIDRSGMISGPSGAAWSVEFWLFVSGRLHRPQDDLSRVKISRNTKTGEVISVWNIDGVVLTERIAGYRSTVDEALISVELNTRKSDPGNYVVAAIRPYNNSAIGGVNSIDVEPGSGLVSVNGMALFGFDSQPDEIIAGSGSAGDIDRQNPANEISTLCGFGMSAAGLKYFIEPGKRNLFFRISLDGAAQIPSGKINYHNLFKEFALFSEMRLAEGIKVDLSDSSFSSLFLQSRLSILNISRDDVAGDSVESYRKLFFFVYALCRSGGLDTAELLFSKKLEEFENNKKKPDFEHVIKGCFLVKSCYELFIHRRETAFLQTYYPSIKPVADYIYRFSVEIHSATGTGGNTDIHTISMQRSIADTIYIFTSVFNISYLARCMGIFGDESKFRNESLRLQSLIAGFFNPESLSDTGRSGVLLSLLSHPEKIFSSMKNDDYREIVLAMFKSLGFPVVHPLFGIDMFSSIVMLNHLYSVGVGDSNSCYNKINSFFDAFHATPEFVDLSVRRGTWGEGNSKIVNAVIFSLLRNRLFIDNQERLELFPVPEKGWFSSGCRVRVEDAVSRFGTISFSLEVTDNEIRLSFSGSPKYLPPDILVNIPYDTAILPGDDFIVKKKIGYNYIISGWPATIRFALVRS